MSWYIGKLDNVINTVEDCLNLDEEICQRLVNKELDDFEHAMPSAFGIMRMSLYEACVLYVIQQSYKKHRDDVQNWLEKEGPVQDVNIAQLKTWLVQNKWERSDADDLVRTTVKLLGNFIEIDLLFDKDNSVYLRCEGKRVERIPQEVISNYENELGFWIGTVGFTYIAHELKAMNRAYGAELAALADSGFVFMDNYSECRKTVKCDGYTLTAHLEPLAVMLSDRRGDIEFRLFDEEYCVRGRYTPKSGKYWDDQIEELHKSIQEYVGMLIAKWEDRKTYRESDGIEQEPWMVPRIKHSLGEYRMPTVERLEKTMSYDNHVCRAWISWFPADRITLDAARDNLKGMCGYLLDDGWEKCDDTTYSKVLNFLSMDINVFIKILRCDDARFYIEGSNEYITLPEYAVDLHGKNLNNWIKETGFQHIARQLDSVALRLLANARFSCVSSDEYVIDKAMGRYCHEYTVIKLVGNKFSEMAVVRTNDDVQIGENFVAEGRFQFIQKDLTNEQMDAVMDMVRRYLDYIDNTLINKLPSSLVDMSSVSDILVLKTERNFCDGKYVSNMEKRYSNWVKD